MSEEEKILDVFENTGDFGKYYLGDYSNEDIGKFIRNILQENKQLKEQLKQRDEAIDEIIKFINEETIEDNVNGCGYIIKGIWDDVLGLDHQYSDLLQILQKYKGDNNE